MTAPGPAARHDGAGDRSPFNGSDVCAAAALPLVPGGRTVMFDQDVWDFGDVAGLAAYLDLRDSRLGFTAITDRRWRLVAKEYIYARLAPADPVAAVLPGACRVPLTLKSCRTRLAETAGWLNWLTSQRIASLGQVTQDHCDRYLIGRRRRKNAAGAVIGTLDDASLRIPAAVIIELADYGELFTADRYAGGFTPWRGRTSSQVAGMRNGGENKTPPLDQQILQPLLAAAFYMTETLGPSGGPAPEDPPGSPAKRKDPAPPRPPSMSCTPCSAGTATPASPCRTRQRGHPGPPGHGVGARGPAAARQLRGPGERRRRQAARPRHHDHRPAPVILDVLGQVGLAKPWARDAAAVTVAGGTTAIPWTVPLDTREARCLAGFLHTACLVLTAMITGMRSCELMELRAGCRAAPSRHPA